MGDLTKNRKIRIPKILKMIRIIDALNLTKLLVIEYNIVPTEIPTTYPAPTLNASAIGPCETAETVKIESIVIKRIPGNIVYLSIFSGFRITYMANREKAVRHPRKSDKEAAIKV